MNDFDDFEARLHQGLNREVDQQLGSPRLPPVFHPPVHERRPWLVPLLAAACVLLLVGVTFGARQLATTHRTQPTAPTPSVTPPPPSGSPTASPTPSSSSSSRQSLGNSANPGGSTPGQTPVTVQLDGATLQLPGGWVARRASEYQAANADPTAGWCLTPQSTPVSTARYSCPIVFNPISSRGSSLDSDKESGFNSNPEFCYPNQGSGGVGGGTARTQSSDRTVGDRAADYRRFDIDCANGLQFVVEQYVVATGPAYALTFEAPAGPGAEARSAALDYLAQHASLPAQSSSVRLYDHGYIRSITPVSGGVRIALDRVVPGPNGPENNNPATYDYLVPSSISGESTLAVGSLFSVWTDGSQVTSLLPG